MEKSGHWRSRVAGWGSYLVSTMRPVAAIILALAAGAGLIMAVGANPLTAYAALFSGSIGSLGSFAATCVRTSPLLLAGLGVGFGFRAGVFNCGAEGQLYVGAAAATAVGILNLPIPGWLHLFLAVCAGFAGGAIWALLPGYLRAYRGISEVVITLMLNYIGIYFVSFLVNTVLGQKNVSYPMSPPIVPDARLPILVPGTSLHAGILLGVILGVVLYVVLLYTPYGFKLRMVGTNPGAARYAGINVGRQMLSVMLISGGLAGLAGAAEVLGLKGRLFDMFSSGLGYDAIAVALLGNSHPLAIILASAFFGALRAGANKMQQTVGIEVSIAVVIQAFTVLFVIGMGVGRRVVSARRRNRARDDKTKGREVLTVAG